jgi:hypothetical protein
LGPFEYLMMFTAVILGLAVCDLAVSIHRLVAAGARVRWDWLAPLAALVVFLKIVSQWWTFFNAGPLAKGLTFEMFLGVLVASVLLFLLAADALPDEAPEGRIDLRAHYESVQRPVLVVVRRPVAVADRGLDLGAGGDRTGPLGPRVPSLAGPARGVAFGVLEEPVVAHDRADGVRRHLPRPICRPAPWPRFDVVTPEPT